MSSRGKGRADLISNRIQRGKKQRGIAKNPRYYAINDHPNFSQFGKNIDFTDLKGRQYRIGYRIGKSISFQSGYYNDNIKKGGKRTCIKGYNGSIKLWVKLPRQNIPWFSQSEMTSKIQITHKSDTIYPISIKSAIRGSGEKKTGYVFVTGLSESLCNSLLLRRTT